MIQPTISIREQLDELAKTWSRRTTAPDYAKSDFYELPTPKGEKRRQDYVFDPERRYVGMRKADIPADRVFVRRQYQRAIGRPIDPTKVAVRKEKWARAVKNGDVRLTVDFKGTVSSYGREGDRSRPRERFGQKLDAGQYPAELEAMLSDWISDPDRLNESAEAAFFTNWWQGAGQGDITATEEFTIRMSA